jgi:hypothetical protein
MRALDITALTIPLPASRAKNSSTAMEIVVAGAADVELGENRVVWRLDRAKAVEIVEDLTVMRDSDSPGHNYVDISSPTKTLVLSRDEYVGVVPPS